MATYTDEQLEYIKANCNKLTYKEIGLKIGKSETSIREKVKRMRIKPRKQSLLTKKVAELFIKYYCTNKRNEKIGEVYELIAKDLRVRKDAIQSLVSKEFPLAVRALPDTE